MESGIDSYSYHDVFDQSFQGATIPVEGGHYEGYPKEGEATVNLVLGVQEESRHLWVLLRQDEHVSVSYELPDSLQAPVSEGEEVGNVTYRLSGETLAVYPVSVSQSIERIDYQWGLGSLWKWYCVKS